MTDKVFPVVVGISPSVSLKPISQYEKTEMRQNRFECLCRFASASRIL